MDKFVMVAIRIQTNQTIHIVLSERKLVETILNVPEATLLQEEIPHPLHQIRVFAMTLVKQTTIVHQMARLEANLSATQQSTCASISFAPMILTWVTTATVKPRSKNAVSRAGEDFLFVRQEPLADTLMAQAV